MQITYLLNLNEIHRRKHIKILHLCWRGHRISNRQDHYSRMRSDAMINHQYPVKFTVGSRLKLVFILAYLEK